MAHVQKYSVGAVNGLSIHFDRKTTNHSNQDIDTERSHLNYDLRNNGDGLDTRSRMEKRLSEVYCMNRADVKPMAVWVLTLPEELKEKNIEEQKAFFEAGYDFMKNRYDGEKNVLSANVHNDETTPHMHFAFMPIVWDEKKQREKVSAKQVLTRTDLKSFHQDLDKFLKETIPGIYYGGVLNDKTYPVNDVAELKRFSKDFKREIEKQKDDITAEFEEHEQKLEKEIQSVDKELKEKKKQLLNLSKALPQKNINIKGRNEIKTEVVQKYIGKSEVIKKETGNVVLTPKQLKQLTGYVNAALAVKQEYERLQKTDLVKENEGLRLSREYLVQENKELETENSNLKEKVQTLNAELGTLKSHISGLQTNIRVLYKQTKKVFKKQFEAFRGLIKNELDMKSVDNHFEREHERESKQEMSKHQEYDMGR